MAVGQAVLSGTADAAELDVLADRLALQELSRGAAHATQLRTLLDLHAVWVRGGTSFGTVPHAALAMGCSEHRAGRLLAEALLLAELPGGLQAVECGLLTVEQSATVADQLSPLAFDVRLSVWDRLRGRLVAEADRGSVLPPARLSELLRRWAVEAGPADAVERRRRAQDGRRLDYRRRADGLGDLFATGFTGPDLQAVLSRIRDRARPVGPYDDRTADQRRFDACRDLLLGRDALPLTDDDSESPSCRCTASAGRAPCGCWPGSPVPCGAEVLVHVTLDAALGASDSPAELVGHGPVEPDLLEQLLLAAPRLRPVWTDADGVPVAVGDRVHVPQRGDPASVRRALLRLADLRPPTSSPQSPSDHVRPPSSPDPAHDGSRRDHRPPDACHPDVPAGGRAGHDPGGYRVPRPLRRLIDVRAPRCEWPGCGARASRCDAEHDVAWPAGPTCSCNLGPCCRRHHRVKQLGWTKHRGAGSSVTWTSPGSGRRWTAPPQHEPPAGRVRPVAPTPAHDPLVELNPLQLEEELWWATACPDDLDGLELRATDGLAVADGDLLADVLLDGDTRWSLDLDDPYAWQDDRPRDG